MRTDREKEQARHEEDVQEMAESHGNELQEIGNAILLLFSTFHPRDNIIGTTSPLITIVHFSSPHL